MTCLERVTELWCCLFRHLTPRDIVGMLPDCGPTWNSPARTSLKDTMAAPSSTSDLLIGGMLPGVMPPTSAWCPAPPIPTLGMRSSAMLT